MERKRISLDKDWKFYLGEWKPSLGKGHGEIYNLSKAGSCAGVSQGDFDASEWEDISLPHDWSIRQPFSEENVADWGYKSRGNAWYRKCFVFPEEYRDKKLVLSFEGVVTHCTVYFNGSVAARSFNGYTPFEIDITDMARFGEIPNVLAVFVDATEWEGWWYEGAGIYRHVWLDVLNPVHIDKDSVFICPTEQNPVQKNDGNGTFSAEKSGMWDVAVSMELINESDREYQSLIQMELIAPNGTQTVKTIEETVLCPIGREKAEMHFTVENPLLWDVDTPNVYSVKVTMKTLSENGESEVLDAIDTVCGFRTVEIDAERGFFLNHRPLKLFGTCNHQDFGGIGVAVPDNLWEYRIEKLKEMGSNAYRCAHGMPADEFIEACDFMGMLVMDENRNYDSSEEGLKQLEMLVKRHRNHPSVVMYSIFNEEPLQGTLQGKRMAKRMCGMIHRLAPNSLTTGAMHGGLLAEDNAALEVDVCGINYQIDGYDSFHEKYPDIPVVATETTSTFGIRGCYHTNQETNEIASYDEDASDWGNNVRDTWKAIMSRDYMAGGFMWTGFDYLGEPTPHVWPSVSSFFGMMDICGFPKDAFYLAKAIFSKEPVCHVLPHWNFKGREGENIRVMSHTNCEEAELFVNGKSFGKKAVDLYQQVTWEVPYESGEIELAGYIGGKKAAGAKQVTTGEATALKLVPWKETMRGNGRDAMPVAIIAVDSEGREVPDANFMTAISVHGGKLLGACNGNPNCHEEYTSEKRSIFNGRCLAVVMPDLDVTELELEVSAEVKQENKTVQINSKKIITVEKDTQAEFIPSVTEYYLTNWKISKVFDERPDVMMKMEDYDMNSWQNISVNAESGSPDAFENQQGKYLIYHIQTQIPKQINGHAPNLYFHSIWGECEIYINGEKRGECSFEWPCDYSLPLHDEETGAAQIRILVKSRNVNAGLNSLVVLR